MSEPSKKQGGIAIGDRIISQVSVVGDMVVGDRVIAGDSVSGDIVSGNKIYSHFSASPNEDENNPPKLKAEVILPAPKDMVVRLVSASSLSRLEEYRSGESTWFSFAGIFVGAILGMLTNLLTGGTFKSESIIVFVVLLAMAGLTGYTAWNYRRKGDSIREQVLKDN